MPTTATWTIIEPGLIHLETTKFCIRLRRESPRFVVEHDGEPQGASGTLEGAKSHTMHCMHELLEMGIEP